MRNLQKRAQDLLGESKHITNAVDSALDLIEGADLLLDVYNYHLLQTQFCHKVPLFPFLPVLDSLRVLAQGGNRFRDPCKLPKEGGCNCVEVTTAVKELRHFLYLIDSVKDKLEEKSDYMQLFGKKIKKKPILNLYVQIKNILPFIEIAEKKGLPDKEMVLTEYCPSVTIFKALYQQDRDKSRFFKSRGYFSLFFHKRQEMVDLINLETPQKLTFKEILAYGVCYPETRTAKILQTHFKKYWEYAKDAESFFKEYWGQANLRLNLSLKDNVLKPCGLHQDLEAIIASYCS